MSAAYMGPKPEALQSVSSFCSELHPDPIDDAFPWLGVMTDVVRV